MSNVILHGLLILDGNLTCSGDINIAVDSVVQIVPDEALKKSFWTGNKAIQSNGCGRVITTNTGKILISGLIDGVGLGFWSNEGPGSNSLVRNPDGSLWEDSNGKSDATTLMNYGATHAGLGHINAASIPIPAPRQVYGSRETPVSLGSGSGYYHGPSETFAHETGGGAAVKVVARSGTVHIDGTINMSGAEGFYAGGGAGGSIWICGWDITGAGSLYSEGGLTSIAAAGGGAGGYISLWYEHSLTYTGFMSVFGRMGSGDGKTYITQVEPVMQEKFTGHILNQKWWETTGVVTLDSSVSLMTGPGVWESSVDSKFSISGRNITVACDVLPVGIEGAQAWSYMRLWSDSSNWIEVSRGYQKVWGRSSDNGIMSAFAAPRPYVPTTMRILGSDGTFAYQFWDASSTTPTTVFTDHLPGLQNRKFTLQLGYRQHSPEDSSVRVDHLRLVSANTAAETVYMDGSSTCLPALNIISGTPQLYGLDFYHSGDRILWDSTRLSLFTAPEGMFVIEHPVLSAFNISTKFVQLEFPPSAISGVSVSIVRGTAQYPWIDFIVTGNTLSWAGLGLDGLLAAGDELVISYYFSPWEQTVPLVDLLAPGDIVRTMYSLPNDSTTLYSSFDAVRIYDGVISGAETKEPVIYVDASKGSDSSAGEQLTPLQNLFVATAWAKRGGTVVLYDGTYSPTEVVRKDLSILGADGADVYITSSLAQDTTGAGWETNALSFRSCQGIVDNVSIGDGTVGVRIEKSPDFEVRRSRMAGLTTGILSVDCDPVFMRNTIHNTNVAFDVSSCTSVTVYSNVVYNCEYGVKVTDTTNLFVTGNTIDDCITGVLTENTHGIVSSNNLTWQSSSGAQISVDSFISVYNNNFFASTNSYTGTPVDASGNISVDPWYMSKPTRDYHLLDSSSPDVGAGTGVFDTLWFDRDGASRLDSSHVDIGAYEFLPDTVHHGVDWYVAGAGEDLRNNGDATRPYRTLDRAMAKADSAIRVDGGHYDSFYFRMCSQSLDLNELTILTTETSGFVSYVTLLASDINSGMWEMPGFVASPSDARNVALGVVGGPAQIYGYDYAIEYGFLVWKGYALEHLLAAGDVLRIFYSSALRRKALNTLVLHSHFGNVDIGRLIIASPSGSDDSILGGDGTNTGGNGSWELPYRTVQTALANSTPGDHIVLRAGEYPMFTPQDGRVLVPYKDRTAVDWKGYGWECIQDPFSPKDFREWGTTGFDEVPWTFYSTGRSTVQSNGGFLSFAYDGSNVPSAVSTFNLFGNWEVDANLCNAIDPVQFSVYGQDNTVSLRYDDISWHVSMRTGGIDSSCWGTANIPTGIVGQFVVEEHVITADDVRLGFFRLQSIPEANDASNVALNVSGGTTQNYGEDFIVIDGLVQWRGLELDGELEPGDLARVLYQDRKVSGPLGVSLSFRDGFLRAQIKDPDWRTVALRNMAGDSSSWKVSFSVSDPDISVDHAVEAGRGFVSDFIAVADSVSGTGLSRPFTVSTERRTVVFYNNPDTTRVDNLSVQADGTRIVLHTWTAPVVIGDDSGRPTSDVNKISVTVDGTSVVPVSLDGVSGKFTMPSAPVKDATVFARYYTNQHC